MNQFATDPINPYPGTRFHPRHGLTPNHTPPLQPWPVGPVPVILPNPHVDIL
ncbi:MAG: hypothetical protein AAFY71_10550 [Bacteroidota bacterium]